MIYNIHSFHSFRALESAEDIGGEETDQGKWDEEA